MTDIMLGGFDTLDSRTKAEAGVFMNVLLPNGNQALSPSGVPVRIKYCGSDSAPYLTAMTARARAAVERQQSKATAAVPKQPDAGDVIVETVDVLVKARNVTVEIGDLGRLQLDLLVEVDLLLSDNVQLLDLLVDDLLALLEGGVDLLDLFLDLLNLVLRVLNDAVSLLELTLVMRH